MNTTAATTETAEVDRYEYRPAKIAHDVDWGRGKQHTAGTPCTARYVSPGHGSLIYIDVNGQGGLVTDSVVTFD